MLYGWFGLSVSGILDLEQWIQSFIEEIMQCFMLKFAKWLQLAMVKRFETEETSFHFLLLPIFCSFSIHLQKL